MFFMKVYVDINSLLENNSGQRGKRTVKKQYQTYEQWKKLHSTHEIHGIDGTTEFYILAKS